LYALFPPSWSFENLIFQNNEKLSQAFEEISAKTKGTREKLKKLEMERIKKDEATIQNPLQSKEKPQDNRVWVKAHEGKDVWAFKQSGIK